MRKVFYGLAGAATLTGTLFGGTDSLQAQMHEPYPWCAVYSGGRDGIGATNCGFDTLAQCRATISGIGGLCEPNPAYPVPARKPVKHRKHRDS